MSGYNMNPQELERFLMWEDTIFYWEWCWKMGFSSSISRIKQLGKTSVCSRCMHSILLLQTDIPEQKYILVSLFLPEVGAHTEAVIFNEHIIATDLEFVNYSSIDLHLYLVQHFIRVIRYFLVMTNEQNTHAILAQVGHLFNFQFSSKSALGSEWKILFYLWVVQGDVTGSRPQLDDRSP